MKRARTTALLAACWITGCSSITNEKRVTIDGTIETVAGDLDGEVHISVHHGWLGEGLLRHPMAFVDRTVVQGTGAFEVSFDVPMDEGGEGLVVYAWHDRDGDGVLCGIDGDRAETAGAAALAEWPAYTATVRLDLDEACAGPETFVP